MFKKGMVFLAVAVSLSGCASKQKDREIQSLKNQMSVLEAEIQAKDEEIYNLREALAKATEGKKEKVIPARPSIEQIQMALKNAGYEPGLMDGKMGTQTREAIKAFQKANDLPVDGKVGKGTWELLKEYLDKKVK